MIRTLLIELLGFFKAARSCLFAPCCRFSPSCTEFAQEALERHSLARATRMILGRILRCHPLHPGGYDPVKAIAESPRPPLAVALAGGDPVRSS